MNAIHVHLLVTHFPILGTLIGAFILWGGHALDQRPTRKIAYLLFIFCGVAAFISSASGEESASLLKHQTSFDPALIEAHQKYAGTAFVWSAILGAASMGAFWLEHKAPRYVRKTSLLLLIVAFANFSLLAWVGWQGGKITHDEIHRVN
jgi:hypothetical protein